MPTHYTTHTQLKWKQNGTVY